MSIFPTSSVPEAETLEDLGVPPFRSGAQVYLVGRMYYFDKRPGGTRASTPFGIISNTSNVVTGLHALTKENVSCETIPKDDVARDLLANYHRLADFSDCIHPIHEIFVTPTLVHIMSPVNFGNLHAHTLDKQKLSEPDASRFFKQIVSAVQYCHGKGIVLRDLKLSKFVFSDGQKTKVKLGSLEHAVILSDLSDDGLSDIFGCPNYFSPEQVDSIGSFEKYSGKETDIYSLGIILYFMLVGKYPFEDDDSLYLFGKIEEGHFTIPEDLSQSVKHLLRSLLRKEPSGRPNCEHILNHPWIVSNGANLQRYVLIPRRSRNSVTFIPSLTATAQNQPVLLNATVVRRNVDQIVPAFSSRVNHVFTEQIVPGFIPQCVPEFSSKIVPDCNLQIVPEFKSS